QGRSLDARIGGQRKLLVSEDFASPGGRKRKPFGSPHRSSLPRSISFHRSQGPGRKKGSQGAGSLPRERGNRGRKRKRNERCGAHPQRFRTGLFSASEY